MAFALPAQGAVLEQVNAIRTAGCGGLEPARTLRASARLDKAARRISRGAPLERALRDAGYEASASALARVRTSGGDSGVRRTLAARFCRTMMNPALRHLGVYGQGEVRWIVFAAPFAAPTARDAASISRRVLALVNEARARPRRCGRERFGAAPALQLNELLARAALRHAEDMARRDFVEHTGSDGSSPGERVKRTGYERRLVGENVAGGPPTPEEVVSGWLESPTHCSNLMEPRFEHMGVAYAVNPRARFRVYWAQVFGDPK